MHDEGHELEESAEDLPSTPMPLQARVPLVASFTSLLPNVLSDQWVAFALVVLLFPLSHLFIDLVFGIDLLVLSDNDGSYASRNADSTYIVLAMGIVWTLAVVLIFRSQYQLIRRLHIHGVLVPCKVVDPGKYIHEGMIDVTLQYQYAGKVYRPRRSVLVEEVKHINQLRIDPENPTEYWVDE